MGDNPAYIQNKLRPIDSVNWNSVQIFLDKLSDLSGHVYRLPNEAEWEYAARGGKHSEHFVFSGSNKLKEVGWYNKNSHSGTKPVGLKLPNELGVFDMSGNVWEWCSDHWHDNYDGALSLGISWGQNSYPEWRVVRGGSRFDADRSCTVSNRFKVNLDGQFRIVGFRLTSSLLA